MNPLRGWVCTLLSLAVLSTPLLAAPDPTAPVPPRLELRPIMEPGTETLNAPPIPEGPEIRLSLDQSVGLALSHNLVLQANLRQPGVTGALARSQKGVFEPRLVAQMAYEQLSNGFGEFTPGVITNSLVGGFSVGMTQRLPAGTTYRIQALILGQQSGLTTLTSGLAATSALNGGELTVQVHHPLMRGAGRVPNLAPIWLAERDYLLAVEALRVQALEVVGRVEALHFKVLALRESVRYGEVALKDARAFDLLVHNRVEEGIAAKYEGLYSQRTLNEIEHRQEFNLAELAVAEAELRILLGLETDPRPLVLEQEELPEVRRGRSAVALSEQAYEHRPEVRQAAIETERRRIQERVERNKTWPVLNLIGEYAVTSSLADLSAIRLGLIYEVPLGRARNEEYRASLLRLEQARLAEQQVRQIIHTQVVQSVSVLESQVRRWEAARKGRTAANELYRLERERYDAGLTPIVNVSTASLRVLEASERETLTRLKVAEAELELERILGSSLDRYGIALVVEPLRIGLDENPTPHTPPRHPEPISPGEIPDIRQWLDVPIY